MNILLIPHAATYDCRGYYLAQYLAQIPGNEVHFMVWDPYPIDLPRLWKNLRSSLKYATFTRNNLTVHKIRRLPFFFPLGNAPLFRAQVRQIFKKHKLDVIISESTFNEVEPPAELPMIYDLVDHHEAYIDLYAGAIERFAIKHILKVKKAVHAQIRRSMIAIAVSDVLVDYVKDVNPDVAVYKIPNGVDSMLLESQLGQSRYNFGRHSLVYISYFGRWANLPKVLDVVRILKADYPDIKLVVVGRGPQIPLARRLSQKWGLAKEVLFTGYVPHDELPEIINGCEVGLSPQPRDRFRDASFPMKLVEYTALGRKVVSSDMREAQLLGWPNIFLYPGANGVDELVKAIKRAFEAELDAFEIRKLAHQYSWRVAAERLHRILVDYLKEEHSVG